MSTAYEFRPDTVFITDKTLERSNGREEDVILAHSLGGFSPGWLGRQSCMFGRWEYCWGFFWLWTRRQRLWSKQSIAITFKAGFPGTRFLQLCPTYQRSGHLKTATRSGNQVSDTRIRGQYFTLELQQISTIYEHACMDSNVCISHLHDIFCGYCESYLTGSQGLPKKMKAY